MSGITPLSAVRPLSFPGPRLACSRKSMTSVWRALDGGGSSDGGGSRFCSSMLIAARLICASSKSYSTTVRLVPSSLSYFACLMPSAAPAFPVSGRRNSRKSDASSLGGGSRRGGSLGLLENALMPHQSRPAKSATMIVLSKNGMPIVNTSGAISRMTEPVSSLVTYSFGAVSPEVR